MKINADNAVVFPGVLGWEVWTGTAVSMTKIDMEEKIAPIDLEELGRIKNLSMVFPVEEVNFVPLRIELEDESLQDELIATQLEQLNAEPDEFGGDLLDVFEVDAQGHEKTLLATVLQPQYEGSLPPQTPKTFELSPRCYSFANDSITVWKELGRFVFAITVGNKLVYAQKLPFESFGEEAVLEAKLAVTQLSFQGIALRPEKLVLRGHDISFENRDLSSLMGLPVVKEDLPSPVLPTQSSKLLPADVRAERIEQQMKQRVSIIGGLLAVLIVGFAIYAFYQWFNLKNEIQDLRKQYAQMAPEADLIESSKAEIIELEPLLDQDNWPVEILYHISLARPRNGGLRLELMEIDENGIKLNGDAAQLQAVNTFDLQLKRNAKLKEFSWSTRPANENTSTGKWEFRFSAKPQNIEGEEN